VDQAIVQQPQPKKSTRDMQSPTWSFDHEAAEARYADALKKALAFTKLEHEVPSAMRALGKAIRDFVITVMPDIEIDRLRSLLAGRGVVRGRGALPENNSANPLQGIVAHFYQYALLQHVKSLGTQHEIDMASRPVTTDELAAGDDEAQRLTTAHRPHCS
jgi:hypothetical protein